MATTKQLGVALVAVLTFSLGLPAGADAIAPGNTQLPDLFGPFGEGTTAHCLAGQWDAAVDTCDYEWVQDPDGTPSTIHTTSGTASTEDTFTLPASAVNKQLTCRVSATNGGGTSSFVRAAETVVVPALIAVTRNGKTITGD